MNISSRINYQVIKQTSKPIIHYKNKIKSGMILKLQPLHKPKHSVILEILRVKQSVIPLMVYLHLLTHNLLKLGGHLELISHPHG